MTEAEKHSFEIGPPIHLQNGNVVDHRARGNSILDKVRAQAALKS